jgi:uncharacterized coiled-coil protein SlyX
MRFNGMETIISTILPYISSSALPLVIVVIAVVWIQTQRKDIGKKRDDFQTLTEYRLKLLEENQSELSESIKELKDSVISLQISVNTLTIELKNMTHNDK